MDFSTQLLCVFAFEAVMILLLDGWRKKPQKQAAIGSELHVLRSLKLEMEDEMMPARLTLATPLKRPKRENSRENNQENMVETNITSNYFDEPQSL
ncbi:Protein of unknown function [Gryllus bimaculatus]|nr:Protein of unknown function [Gryllus bimaculatus]